MSSNFDTSILFTSNDSWLYNLEIKEHLGRKTGHEDKIYPWIFEKKFEEFRKQQEVKFKKKILMSLKVKRKRSLFVGRNSLRDNNHRICKGDKKV